MTSPSTSQATRGDVLLMTPRIPFLIDPLEREYTVHRAEDDAWREASGRIRAVVTNGVVGCPPQVVRALPNLGLIAVGGVGLDAVDVAGARERGIHLTTTPDVSTVDVADLALALVLAASRRVAATDRYVRDGLWPHEAPLPLTWRVSGKRAGIVGLGRIGLAVARRLAAMDMPIAYTGRSPKPEVPYQFVGNVVELARASDVLVVSAAAGPETRHLIGAEVLRALGSTGVLVNVARGSLVDEAALVSALREGQLGAAGLDVFTDEPHVPAALLELDQVVLSPHAATRTVESRQQMAAVVLANLRAFFAGEPLLTPLT